MMNMILGDGMEDPGGGSPVEDKLKVDVGAVRYVPIHADTKNPPGRIQTGPHHGGESD